MIRMIKNGPRFNFSRVICCDVRAIDLVVRLSKIKICVIREDFVMFLKSFFTVVRKAPLCRGLLGIRSLVSPLNQGLLVRRVCPRQTLTVVSE